MPGLINAHGHVQDERGGMPQPLEYELKLWLARGVTTVRDVGSNTRKTLELRAASAAGTVVGAADPGLCHVRRRRRCGGEPGHPHRRKRPGPGSAQLKAMGVDGIKIVGIDRDLMQAMEDEAQQGRAADCPPRRRRGDQRLGRHQVRHPEHRALVRRARRGAGGRRAAFPADYNYNNEVDRFRWAGRLWREADPSGWARCSRRWWTRNVAWVPTLVIYEASRDLLRAQNRIADDVQLHAIRRRAGGLRPGMAEAGAERLVGEFPRFLDEFESLLTGNEILMARTQCMGVLSQRACREFRSEGAGAAGNGRELRHPQGGQVRNLRSL